jgi:hypothetical protein
MTMRERNAAHTLDARVGQVPLLQEIRKTDLISGDRVLVTTENSRYMIEVLADGYTVWGG